MKESKEMRFKRIVEARVNKITQMLRLLGNCSFKGNYEYTEEQVDKIFDRLNSELEKAHQKFTSSINCCGRFSLSDNYTCNGNPMLIMPLPNGMCLRAVAAEDDMMPNMSIYLQTGDGDEEKSVCYAEYNYEREPGKELCIGVWNSQHEDPYFYESFNSETDNAKLVKLLCNVGDVVYQTDTEKTKIYSSTVKEIILGERIIYDTDTVAFDERAIGQSVFLTREDAEANIK